MFQLVDGVGLWFLVETIPGSMLGSLAHWVYWCIVIYINGHQPHIVVKREVGDFTNELCGVFQVSR